MKEVRTKQALEEATSTKTKRIVIKGELADKVNKSFKILKLSKITLAALGASLASIPFTVGMSAVPFAAAATFTGLEISTIVAVAFLGFALVLHVIKDYKKVSFSVKNNDTEAELILKNKELN